jgi:hypothetical protein
VESDQYIGSLLSANDELVKALMAFEIMDKSIDDDSDSETEQRSPQSASPPTSRTTSGVGAAMAGLHLNETAPPKPPRPASIPMPPASYGGKQKTYADSEPEEDDDDPFSDVNGKKIPYYIGIGPNSGQLSRHRMRGENRPGRTYEEFNVLCLL